MSLIGLSISFTRGDYPQISPERTKVNRRGRVPSSGRSPRGRKRIFADPERVGQTDGVDLCRVKQKITIEFRGLRAKRLPTAIDLHPFRMLWLRLCRAMSLCSNSHSFHHRGPTKHWLLLNFKTHFPAKNKNFWPAFIAACVSKPVLPM